MKRYGQRVITLKDMLVEYLMAHMAGASFKQLKEALGASVFGLKKLLVEMERDGEILQVELLRLVTEQEAISEYIRMRMSKGSFLRRIPPVQLTNDDLDRQVDTDKPVKVVDVEPQPSRAVADHSGGVSVVRELNHLTGEFEDVPLSQEEIEQTVALAAVVGGVLMADVQNVPRNIAVFKLSPRMWIEEAAGI